MHILLKIFFVFLLLERAAVAGSDLPGDLGEPEGVPAEDVPSEFQTKWNGRNEGNGGQDFGRTSGGPVVPVVPVRTLVTDETEETTRKAEEVAKPQVKLPHVEPARTGEVVPHREQGESGLPGAPRLNSEEKGYQNLGEYQKAMPAIVQETENALEFGQRFQKALEVFTKEKQAQAENYRQMQQQALARAQGLNEIPDERGQRGGKLLSQNEQSRMPSAGDPEYTGSGARPGKGSPYASGGAIENRNRLVSEPMSGRNRLSKPITFEPEAKQRAKGESERDAIAKNFAGVGKLDIGSTISASEKVQPAIASEESVASPAEAGKFAGAKPSLLPRAGRSALLKPSREKGKLRQALLQSMGPGTSAEGGRPEESAAQSALRGVLESAQVADSGKAGSAPSQAAGSGKNAEGFAMAGSETDAAVQAFTRGVGEEQSAEGVLGAESNDLFVRIHAAHRRSEKNWQQRQLQANL